MVTSYLFNPENDVALASGLRNYTPPSAAAALALSGAMLPWWLGAPGDAVLVPRGLLDEARRWAEATAECFGEGPRPVVTLAGIDAVEPWGWSAYTLRLLEKAGCPEALLRRHSSRIEVHRQFSHRRTAAEVLRRLGDNSVVEARSWQEVERFATEHPAFYLKAPWSSSGRGVFRSIGNLRELAEGIIRRQGSVMLEPAYDGVQDFAMLFRADGAGAVRFEGYSLFDTEGTPSYTGNRLLTDDNIEACIAGYVGREKLTKLREQLAGALGETATAHGYRGPLGVDMLVYRSTGGYAVAPCLEVNCRYTMGFVAHALVKRGLRGRMTAIPDGSPLPGGAVLLSPAGGSYRFVALPH